MISTRRRERLPLAITLGVLLAAGLLAEIAAAQTPTPTPRPRLSGGFGRPRSNPTPRPDQPGSDGAKAAGEGRVVKPPAEKAAVTISNQTLVTDPQKGKVSTSSGGPAKSTPASVSRTYVAEAPSGASGTPPPGTASETALDEAKWREAAKSARDRVQDGKGLVEQLTAEVAKLEADFYSWDDGQYRDNVIKPAWDKKKEELEAAKKELAAAEQDLADLPERARKAGALPGWLRE